MRISDWSSDVCSSDLLSVQPRVRPAALLTAQNAATDEHTKGDAQDNKGRRKRNGREQPREWYTDQQPCRARQTAANQQIIRSEEHTSELQSLMRISYAVFCLKKKNKNCEIQLLTTHPQKTNKQHN